MDVLDTPLSRLEFMFGQDSSSQIRTVTYILNSMYNNTPVFGDNDLFHPMLSYQIKFPLNANLIAKSVPFDALFEFRDNHTKTQEA